jgi:hypothetical protein
VRTLEAAETLADVDGQTEAGEQIHAVRENLVR